MIVVVVVAVAAELSTVVADVLLESVAAAEKVLPCVVVAVESWVVAVWRVMAVAGTLECKGQLPSVMIVAPLIVIVVIVIEIAVADEAADKLTGMMPRALVVGEPSGQRRSRETLQPVAKHAQVFQPLFLRQPSVVAQVAVH